MEQVLIPRRGFFQPAPDSELHSLDADHAFFSKCIDDDGGKFNCLQQFQSNNWLCHIQFEIPRLPAQRNRHIAADDMRRDLDDRFAENG
jgi:hypothetical protein